MGQQANLTVFDGATTPVSHTLKTDGVNRVGDLITASWRETNSAVPDGAQIRFTQMKQKLRSGTVKNTSRVEVPVMESVAGQNAQGYTAAPKVAFVDRFEFSNFSSTRATGYGKRVAMQILLNLLNNVSVTTPAISAGICAELHQDGLVVS
jgi:hypothetical protein